MIPVDVPHAFLRHSKIVIRKAQKLNSRSSKRLLTWSTISIHLNRHLNKKKKKKSIPISLRSNKIFLIIFNNWTFSTSIFFFLNFWYLISLGFTLAVIKKNFYKYEWVTFDRNASHLFYARKGARKKKIAEVKYEREFFSFFFDLVYSERTHMELKKKEGK